MGHYIHTNMLSTSSPPSELLLVFGHAMPSEAQLARHIGFTEEELTSLQLFWDAAFNGSFIYLSKDMVLEKMTGTNNKNSYKRFIDKQLLAHPGYVENTDYKRLEATDPLIKAYYDSTKKRTRTHAATLARMSHYAVTGETYRDLLTRADTTEGIESRKLYRKIEKLAKMMTAYAYQLQLHQAEQKMASLSLAKERNQRIDRFLANVTASEPNTILYIASSNSLAKEHIFKPGHLDGLSRARQSRRLSMYNSLSLSDDKVQYRYMRRTHRASEIDTRLRRLLKDFRYSKRKELVVFPYGALVKIVNMMIDNHDHIGAVLDEYISGPIHIDFNRAAIVPPPLEIKEVVPPRQSSLPPPPITIEQVKQAIRDVLREEFGVPGLNLADVEGRREWHQTKKKYKIPKQAHIERDRLRSKLAAIARGGNVQTLPVSCRSGWYQLAKTLLSDLSGTKSSMKR